MSPSPTELPMKSCTFTRDVLNRVGDKWSLYIVVSLASGSMRFMELKRSIDDISQRMLTLTLKGLEKDGLVTRTMGLTVPPRVDYELTPLGRTLLEPVFALVSWAEKHQPEIEAARNHYIGQELRRPYDSLLGTAAVATPDIAAAEQSDGPDAAIDFTRWMSQSSRVRTA